MQETGCKKDVSLSVCVCVCVMQFCRLYGVVSQYEDGNWVNNKRSNGENYVEPHALSVICFLASVFLPL